MTGAVDADTGAPPLSVSQEALWYMSLLDPYGISYNETVSIRKDGPLDVDALRLAFNEVVRRHEAWRTTFDTVLGEPVQVVHPPPHFDLPLTDLSHLTREGAERQAVHLAAETSKVPYDLRRGPLVRPRLIRFPGDEHRLYLAMHHVIFDGVTVYRVVLPEIIALYDAFATGLPSPLPEPQSQYRDFARWEQEWITGPRVERRVAYWREHLDQAPALSLPLDRPRPQEPRYRGGVIPLVVPPEDVERLQQVGRDAGATLFQVLAATWSVLLSRYSGQQDVVFSTAADLRQRSEFEGVVGYCLTPLALRVDLSGGPSFADLVVRVRNELLDALDHVVPFERLVRELIPEGSPGANPVYQTMLVLEPATISPDPSWSIHQMEGGIGDAVGATKLDLELELDERPEGHLAGRLIYDRDLFEPATVERMAQHWLRVLGSAAADPSQPASRATLLTPAEEHRQLVEWNATATERSADGVHDLIRATSHRRPDAIAVSAGDVAISYAELDSRSDGLASRLLAGGVAAGDVLALRSEPSVDLVISSLGALKAGAACLFLDPDLGEERAARMLAESGATELTRDARKTNASGPGATTDGLHAELCCLQYTSEGKGVPISHVAAVNLAKAMAVDLSLGPADTVLALPASVFAVPVIELWMPLIAGARIVIAPSEAAADGRTLSRLIKSERVTFLHATPSTWQGLIDSGMKAARSLRALSGGEALSRELADGILERCRVLWNAYGAVETTVYSTLARVERSEPITIGRPIANTRTYVLDGHDRPVPVGVAGELMIAGVGVADGYFNGTDPSAEAFVEEPFGSGPAFRTGALARWLPSGELELEAGSLADAQPEERSESASS